MIKKGGFTKGLTDKVSFITAIMCNAVDLGRKNQKLLTGSGNFFFWIQLRLQGKDCKRIRSCFVSVRTFFTLLNNNKTGKIIVP